LAALSHLFSCFQIRCGYTQRRKFLKLSSLSAATLTVPPVAESVAAAGSPLFVSTWAPNVKAKAAAWQLLQAGGCALDAVHTGVQMPEADPDDQSVG
jgi:N4-(beta-N-acetylglucosaminyl)-L-asparaginase